MFVRSRPWLSLGPGWAALAGLLSTGQAGLNGSTVLRVVGLWLLVDPLLGTLWTLSVEQGLWRHVAQAQLPPPPRTGLILPYAQPGSLAEQMILLARRYRLWWLEQYRPEFGAQITTFGVALLLACLLGLALKPALVGLVLVAVILIVIAGLTASDLATAGGGRLQSLIQFLLPWLMGAILMAVPNLLVLLPALCFWAVYLGALRLAGQHKRAEWLYFGGQFAAALLLLGAGLLPGATLLATLLLAQMLLKTKFPLPDEFLPRVQLYLVIGVVVAGLSVGGA
jgi:hypothetical protein